MIYKSKFDTTNQCSLPFVKRVDRIARAFWRKSSQYYRDFV